jgi:hypothetical protein
MSCHFTSGYSFLQSKNVHFAMPLAQLTKVAVIPSDHLIHSLHSLFLFVFPPLYTLILYQDAQDKLGFHDFHFPPLPSISLTVLFVIPLFLPFFQFGVLSNMVCSHFTTFC